MLRNSCNPFILKSTKCQEDTPNFPTVGKSSANKSALYSLLELI